MIHNSLFKINRLHRFFFYLLIVLLPTQLGYHFWPEWSHVLGRRIDYLSPTLYITDILVLLTFGIWFIDMGGFRKMNYELRIMNYGKNISTIIRYSLFITLIVSNIITSLSPFHSLYQWIKVLEYSLLAVYIIKTKPSKSYIVTLLSVALFYSSLIAIIQFYLQRSIGGPLWLLGERTFSASTPGIAQFPIFLEIGSWKLDLGLMLRSYATFPHPNVLGGFIAITIPMLIGELKDSHLSLRIKQFFHINIAISIAALLLTFSRSAWFLGVIGISYIMFKKQIYELRSRNYAVWNLSIAIALGIVLYSLFLIRASTSESVIVRLALNESAVSIWRQHVWFGVGLGNFITALPSFLPSHFIYFLQPVHNIYLLVLSEIGIVGVSLMCLSIYHYRNNELRLLNNGKKEKTIFHASLYMLLLLGLVDHYPLTVQQGQLLLTVLLALNVL